MSEKEKIIAKLQKLVNLKESAEEVGSLEEAANATARIQDLLTKYNLEMADIGTEEEEKTKTVPVVVIRPHKDSGLWKRNESVWIVSLMTAIARNNQADTVNTFKNIAKVPPVIWLFAQEGTHEYLIYLWESLIHQLRKLEPEYYNQAQQMGDDTKRNKFRRDFFHSATNVIRHRLEEEKEKLEREEAGRAGALVVLNNRVQQTISEQMGTTNQKARRATKISSGTFAGAEAGERVNISKGRGVTGQAKNQKTIQ